MRGSKLLSAMVSACAVIALLALAGPVQARVVRLPSGRVLSILPAHGVHLPSGVSIPHLRRAAVAGCDSTTNAGVLTYGCGPVVHSSNPYLIYWTPSGTSIGSGSRSLLQRYLTDTSTSGTEATDVFGVDRQYFDSTGYAGQAQTFSASAQTLVDTQPYPTTGNCPTLTRYSTCLTDEQVQAEISRVISAQGWPAGGTSSNAPIYFLVLPQTVDECIDTSGTTCADNYFCAYHDAFVTGGADTLYSLIPMALLDLGKGCQYDGNTALQEPNGDAADIVLDSFSHEFNETITDPVGGTGWFDTTDNAEIGDLCSAYGPIADPSSGTDPNAYLPILGGSAAPSPADGTLYDQLINSHQYYTQTEWSNGASDCRAQPASATLTPVISSPTTATTNPVSFDPSSSTATAGLSSATWDFGDGTSSFASGPLTTVPHTYAAPGSYNVTLTLVDDQGELAKVTQGITIPGPSAAFTLPTSAPIGTPVSFDASSSSDTSVGGTIQSYAWSFGDGSSGTGPTPEHTYRTPGSHVVSLTVKDSHGFYSTKTTHAVTITVAPLVAAAVASPTKVLTGQTVSFGSGGSSDPNAGGSISAYRWNFGDGATGTGANVNHAYSAPGLYTARLTISDPYGLTASHPVGVTVVAVPKITRVSTSLKRHVHYLLVTVNQAGTVTAAKVSATLVKAGTAAIKLGLTRSQLKRLAAHRVVKLHLVIVYSPAFGPVTTVNKTVSLKR